ncbi:MAG: histidine kinase [Nocardioides sp.]
MTPEISSTVLVGISVAGLMWLVSGLALLATRRTPVAAVLLGAAGAALSVATVLSATGHDAPAWVLVVAACGLLLPVALTSYPLLRWRHPVDFVALVVIAGSGALMTAQSTDDVVAGALALVSGVVFFAHTWWRIERSADRERRALLWMALTVGTVGMVTGALSFATEAAAVALFSVALFGLIGPATYVGVALPDIVDVRGLVVSTVVFTVAVVTYVALFVSVASLLEVAGGRQPSVGALAVVGALVATTFAPLEVMLRGVVDELLFGRRPDPLGAANVVAGRIGEDPLLALRAIREALVLPYAALRDAGGDLTVSGTATTHTRTIALPGLTTSLVVGLRPGDLRLSRDDEHVLALTAPLLAHALRAQTLAAEVQESRGQTVAALEEERRRLRRDLHDGLGPRLSGIAFTSDAVRNLLRSDPAAAEELLHQLRAETVTAIGEIRQLVYAMRPPALDELGLVPALRQQAAGLRSRTGAPLAVTLTAPADLPPLSAAVEVAAYRIVVEALTNVARHSPSEAAAVRIEAPSGWLSLVVTDGCVAADGAGSAWQGGIGLTSMRERAAEVGGSVSAGPTPAGGRVEALLPLG